MLTTGPAKRVTIYVTENVQYQGQPLYLAVLTYLLHHGVTGATVTRGIAGFGADHHLHTHRIEVLSVDLPIKIEFIEDEARLQPLLPKLQEMVSSGLIEIQDTTVVKPSRPDATAAEPPPRVALRGRAKMVRIHIGENDRWHDERLYDAIVQQARAHDLAGATVYRGIEGYGASTRIHRPQLFGRSADLPILVTIIDEGEKIDAFLPVLESMVTEGMIAISDVDVIRYVHRAAPAAEAGDGR